jgi:hypothetical protein
MTDPAAFSNEFTSLLLEGDPTRAIYVSSHVITIEELSEGARKSLFDQVELSLCRAIASKVDQTLVLTFPPNKSILRLYSDIQVFLGQHHGTKSVTSTIRPFPGTTHLEVVCGTAANSNLTIKFVGLCINVYPLSEIA